MVLAATPNQPSSGQQRGCFIAAIDNESMALMQCPSVLSAPTLMGYLYAYISILRAPHTMRRVDVVLATPKQASSGLRRACSTVAIEKESMAFMLRFTCSSLLTAMGHYYSVNAMLRTVHKFEWLDVVLVHQKCSLIVVSSEVRVALYIDVY